MPVARVFDPARGIHVFDHLAQLGCPGRPADRLIPGRNLRRLLEEWNGVIRDLPEGFAGLTSRGPVV